MKRRELEKHLAFHGCEFLREGARHSVFVNTKLRVVSTVPRRREADDFLVCKICRDSGIPTPR